MIWEKYPCAVPCAADTLKVEFSRLSRLLPSGYASTMTKLSAPIRVDVEYTNTPEAERAVIDALKFVLKEPSEESVDNPFDGSAKTR